MFKYLLFKGFADIMDIFSSAKAEAPSVIKAHLHKANEQAAPVWNDQSIPFTVRAHKCGEILDVVVNMNQIPKTEDEVLDIPPSLVDKLNKSFRKFYGTIDKLMLIGQTHEEAYAVQDKYAREVAHILGTEDKRFESRAITCFRKIYGRNFVPLLTMGSVSGLWQICQSGYYKKTVSLVSSLCPVCLLPC